ncbi:rubredoxin [Paraflavisolibacter sp. H34]|uniref:rubredoxin n=1 Tax=Huijunlia imazamoxiresistens TaxID=3127457 RepID=UPI003016D825
MFKKSPIVKINLPGGIVSAGDLYSILVAAEKAKVEDVQFGIRQQLYLKPAEKHFDELKKNLEEAGIPFEDDTDLYPNILSSYVAEGVFENTNNWLSEGVYKDVLDLFDYRPRLKVNLVDDSQTFTPFFTGNLNFITSPVNNYWYLYIRFPKTNTLYRWKGLVYSFDIPRISKLIETVIFENPSLFYDREGSDGDQLHALVHGRDNFITQPVTTELVIPEFSLPYYEGFNYYGNKTWLGIYRRDELFPVAFLKDVCLICLQSKIGQLYTTPWKSLIIKGIDSRDRKLWEMVLGKYRINVRHASNELNWQVEDFSEEALTLKRYIIRQFDRDDVRTSGLCFAVKLNPKIGLFGSIIIRKKENDSASRRKALDRYDILYTRNFNPNSKDLLLFRQDVEKENLGVYLISLSKYYYEQQQSSEDLLHHIYQQEASGKEAGVQKEEPKVYHCKHCYTVYDESYGDEGAGIAPGTPFAALPHTYECPVCSAAKEDFVRTEGVAVKM